MKLGQPTHSSAKVRPTLGQPFNHTLVYTLTLPGVYPPTLVPEADEVQHHKMRNLGRFNLHNISFTKGRLELSSATETLALPVHLLVTSPALAEVFTLSQLEAEVEHYCAEVLERSSLSWGEFPAKCLFF
jgi:hypothetical protein